MNDRTSNTNRIDPEKLEKLSHATIEQALDAIFWLDVHGRIRRANNTACKLMEEPEEQLVQKMIQDYDIYVTWDSFLVLMQEKRIYPFETVMRKSNGSMFPIEVICYYVEFEDTGYICGSFRDITRRKAMQNALETNLQEIKQLKDRLQAENSYLQEEIRTEHNYGEMIGCSSKFKKVLQQIKQVSTTNSTVLILGKSGTGKELVVRAIHNFSQRKNRPLVKINCAALPTNLIESELFGHEKGAFTGALIQKKGRFEIADGGILFLDEIGDLPFDVQAKLLRVLQENEFERVGGIKTIKVDVRIIAATNRDLEQSVQEGKFRDDLFYRLNVFPITVPLLKERKEDIPLLVDHFISKFTLKMGKPKKSVPKEMMDQLIAYSWPGNIRELENIIERSIIISNGKNLKLGDWFNHHPKTNSETKLVTIHEMERNYIMQVLEQTSWRIRGKFGASEILGLKPTTLEARMAKLGINRY